jgi:hypothetical protein
MSQSIQGRISDRIAALERRLENRRARLREDASEATFAASRTARSVLPIAAAVSAGLLALWFTHRRPEPPRRRSFYSSRIDDRRGLRWASLAGIVGTAFRIGTSPQVRALWRAFRNSRQPAYARSSSRMEDGR